MNDIFAWALVLFIVAFILILLVTRSQPDIYITEEEREYLNDMRSAMREYRAEQLMKRRR